MAHNFRKTGNFYVSKAGSDANSGTDPDNPKATINAALGLISAVNQTIIICTGLYEEAINRTGITYFGTTLTADGYVKCRGNGSNSFGLFGSGQFNLNGLVFENYSAVIFSGTGGVNIANNCDFINVAQVHVGTSGTVNGTMNYCKFIDSNVVSTFTASNGVRLDTCIVINGAHSLQACLNTYFNGGSTMNIKSSTNSNNFICNNVMGNLSIGGTAYATLADQIAAQPSYNTRSFNASARFNNASKYDFTLQADSPHIGAGNNGQNIGGTNYAKSSDMSIAREWTVAGGAVVSSSNGTPDLVLSGSDWVINTAQGKTSGTIKSGPIPVSPNAVQLGVVNYNGLKLFNKSVAGNTSTNNNVPDSLVYSAGDAGNSPDRLVYEMMWTDSEFEPQVDGDYNNNLTGLIAVGQFTKFEMGIIPMYDNTGKGNGEPGYNPAVTFIPNVTYACIKLTLTNRYSTVTP